MLAAGMVMAAVAVPAAVRASPAAAAAGASTAAAVAPCLSVTGVQPPSPGTQFNKLGGVAVLSPCDAWAVGSSSNLNSNPQTLIEHWDGANWTVVPNPESGSAVLNAVAASSATDVWAVGEDSSSGSGQNLIEHWNGSAWSVVPSPSVPGALLSGVTATSATNAWAVGVSETSSAVKTVVEHWNGTAWSIVPSPNPGSIDNEPASVTATSTTNAWMVGSFRNSDPATHEFIAHWDGTAWTLATSPTLTGNFNVLNGVRATSASNAWAVGQSGSRSAPQTVTEHWNGSAWTLVSSPTPGAGGSLSAVTVTGTSSALAVGRFSPSTSGGSQSLILRWDGTAWTQVLSPSPGTSSQLLAVAGPATSGSWSVGFLESSTGPAEQAFALHCC